MDDSKLNRLREELKAAKKKRDSWEAKVKDLERRYNEAEKVCVYGIFQAANMTPEQLADVIRMLNEEKPTVQEAMEPGHSGFGLRNVDMRIRLYYRKEKGLRIVSGPGGTEVSFTIPIRTREEIDHDESLSRG